MIQYNLKEIVCSLNGMLWGNMSHTMKLDGEEQSIMLEQRSPGTEEIKDVQQGTLFDKATLEQLKDERRQWEETTVSKSQQRLPERDNLITTSSVPINR